MDDKATYLLIVRFAQLWLPRMDSMSPAEALAKAQRWLRQDPRLLPVVDDAIGRQVRALEQRQRWQHVSLAFITTVGGALLGWLTSLLRTPTNVLHLLSH